MYSALVLTLYNFGAQKDYQVLSITKNRENQKSNVSANLPYTGYDFVYLAIFLTFPI